MVGSYLSLLFSFPNKLLSSLAEFENYASIFFYYISLLF